MTAILLFDNEFRVFLNFEIFLTPIQEVSTRMLKPFSFPAKAEARTQ